MQQGNVKCVCKMNSVMFGKHATQYKTVLRNYNFFRPQSTIDYVIKTYERGRELLKYSTPFIFRFDTILL